MQESKGNEKHVTMIQTYREKIEKELSDICSDVIAILQTNLIPKAASPESKVFYYKMYALFSNNKILGAQLTVIFLFFFFLRVGDYHRYLAEFSQGDHRNKASTSSLEGYKAASEVADKEVMEKPLLFF